MAVQKVYGSIMLVGLVDNASIIVTSNASILANPGVYAVSAGNPSVPNSSYGYLYVMPLDGVIADVTIRFHAASNNLWYSWIGGQWQTVTPAGIGALGAQDIAVAARKLNPGSSIGGVHYDGSVDINLPGVNAMGNQSTTGNAASATRLQTARTINGVSFNGTANITISAAAVGAYTTAQCNANFLTGFRLTAQVMTTEQQAPASALVSYVDGGDDADGIGYRTLQFLRNGVYVTVGQA